MKPIKLVIKGLNSFKDEQTIDFNKLIDRGLFGIFGPTGSGKSTILDGITLALYGKTSRDSSNFINTQCDEMNVRYEFKIREKEEKYYIVDRTFKRNKNGGINGRTPTRVIEVVNGKEEILNDTISTVDKKCIEIMGLKFEDFIRTVVLPQGKFSEFLKLEGKQRRDMLERLFSLDKYGEGLTRKLGSVIKKENLNMAELEGKLNEYKDINEDSYKEKEKEFEEAEAKKKVINQQLDEINKNHSDSNQLWNLQQDFEKYQKEKTELESQNENIEKYNIQVKRGISSSKVKPHIDFVNVILEDIKKTEVELLKHKTSLKSLEDNKAKVYSDFNEIKIKKDFDIPKLKVIDNNIINAIEEEVSKTNLAEDLINLREKYKKLKENENEEEGRVKKLENKIKELNESIKLSEDKIEGMKIDELHRAKVQNGLISQGTLAEKRKRKNELEKDKEETLKKIEDLKNKVESDKNLMEEKQRILDAQEDELKKISSNCPGDSTMLLEKQRSLSNLRIVVKEGTEHKKELDKLKNEVIKLEDSIKTNMVTKDHLEKELEDLNIDIEEINRENLANILRADLKADTPCPVCGSKEHHYINNEKVDDATLNIKNKELKVKQNELNSIRTKIAVDEDKLKYNNGRISDVEKELSNLGEEWINVNIQALEEEFKFKEEEIKKWTSTKESLDKNIKELKEELNTIKTRYSTNKSLLEENENNLKKYSEDFKKVSAEFDDALSNFNSLKDELKIEDFSKRNKEIIELDRERSSLQELVKKNRTEVDNKVEERDKLKNAFDKIRSEIAVTQTEEKQKSDQFAEKEQSIKNKVGERNDLVNYKNEIDTKIKEIETSFNNIEQQKNKIEEEYAECYKNVKVYEDRLEKSNSDLKSNNLMLEEALKSEGFKDKDEAISFYISSDKIKELEELINDHGNKINQLKGKIQDVVNKIDGRTITSEQWDEIKKLKADKEVELQEASEKAVEIRTKLDDIKERLEIANNLREEEGKLVHKLSLLNDLDKLFKGKRFVEFVAMHQLKYVSLEASKRLKEITNGTYGLEVDEDGKFIIRDYKNGGATRDASTLSGGETFLASLALALALSAQIQLKGTAPLELFFLDEGFGTLDDNLLEIVMGSIEKIHNDKLSVGIISHVESIKNRVPVKLIISPAESGIGGSKVKIERT